MNNTPQNNDSTSITCNLPKKINCLPNERGFKMAFLNIVSLPRRFDEINLSMSEKLLDIMSLSETRLDSTINDSMIHVDGYDVIRKDRCRNGGEICAYLRSSSNYHVRSDLVPSDLEAICLEICKPHSRPFMVVTIYRPPDAPNDFLTQFESFIKAIENENKEIYILGDLNCDLIKQNLDQHTKKLKSLFEIYQLTQLVNEATRITSNSSTLIDHFITNEPKKISKCGVVHTGINDHSLIYVFRKINCMRENLGFRNTTEIRNMKRFSEERLLLDLSK